MESILYGAAAPGNIERNRIRRDIPQIQRRRGGSLLRAQKGRRGDVRSSSAVGQVKGKEGRGHKGDIRSTAPQDLQGGRAEGGAESAPRTGGGLQMEPLDARRRRRSPPGGMGCRQGIRHRGERRVHPQGVDDREDLCISEQVRSPGVHRGGVRRSLQGVRCMREVLPARCAQDR